MLFPIILSRKSTTSFVTSNLSKQMFQPKTASFHQSSLPPCALFSEKATCPEVEKGSPLKFIMVGSWGQKIRLRGQIPPQKKLTWEWENSPFRCISYWTMDNFPMSIFSFKGRKKKHFSGRKKNLFAICSLIHWWLTPPPDESTTSCGPSCECIKSIDRWKAYAGDSSMQA